ncbi:hypothetical protein ACFSCX_02170 [Bacillus salitolerans]|uniref:Uncharacterized protein n=1 Tax=Bacillus salitolerans TaxID=1437434 RepID=A0ABW4LJS9_9BACI
MGYILPIDHHQYAQYANRTVKDITSPFELLPVFEASLEKRLKKEKKGSNQDFTENKERDDISRKERSAYDDKKIPEALISEITGKGQLFNQSI